jgi:flavodoxin I
MKKIGIFYGSSTGNCEIVAMELQQRLGKEQVDVYDVATCQPNKLSSYQNLIFGVSTWGIGQLQDDWEDFLPVLTKENLAGKTIALYGLGDQQTYADSFVDGLGIMYDYMNDTESRIIGEWPLKGYDFHKSKAVRNNTFVGLVIDEDSQSNQTHNRIEQWIEQIKNEFH